MIKLSALFFILKPIACKIATKGLRKQVNFE